MGELVDASLAFPSVVLSILVGIALLYWLFVILGALDLDLFHSDVDVGGHGHDIGGHGGHGHDVGGHGGHGHDVGGHGGHGHDVGGHGGHGHDAGGHDGAGHSEAGEAGEGSGGVSTFLAPLGLRRVPITISITFILVFAWTICLLAMHLLAPLLPGGALLWLFGTLVLLGALILSLPLTAIAITPLAPAFVTRLAQRRHDNIGATCTVTTGHVDQGFGQAKITDQGLELVIPVRCDSDGNHLARYDKALVIDYDDAREAYLIEPLDDVLKAKTEEE